LLLGIAFEQAARGVDPHRPDSPESRAVGFLGREVPLWSKENRCFSCHNNGDAARALYHAARAGYPVAESALAETTRWLTQPERWEHNGGEGAFSDKKLARIAFTAALGTAVRMGRLSDKGPLERAAELLARDQAADGSWSIEGENSPGTPAAYGRPLATLLCREALAGAGAERYRGQVGRADAWLARMQIATVTDASVALLAGSLPQAGSTAIASRSPPGRALELLRRAQSSDDGGWGPFVTSPSEVFDTALALLALASWRERAEMKSLIARGRSFLIDQQQTDGSWVETTRPAGGVSYAQRISTSGWATLALLATSPADLAPAAATAKPSH
jgi:hypothetical protein